MSSTAFVGDVHGNLAALQGLLKELDRDNICDFVFLGDYVNKGIHSFEVIEELLRFRTVNRVVLLRGNHEAVMLETLESGDLTSFLKIGGAATIRSYIGGPTSSNPIIDFRESIPASHYSVFKSMPEIYENDFVVATHAPLAQVSTSKFRISAHRNIGNKPIIRKTEANIDTGCGNQGGFLTALLWPELSYVQVDDTGQRVN